MMHNPVTELRCKYFTLLRVIYYKTGGISRAILTRYYIITQGHKFSFKIKFKLQLIESSPFMTTGILVSLVQIDKKLPGGYLKKKERTIGGCKF